MSVVDIRLGSLVAYLRDDEKKLCNIGSNDGLHSPQCHVLQQNSNELVKFISTFCEGDITVYLK